MQEVADSDNETDTNLTQETLVLSCLAAGLQERI